MKKQIFLLSTTLASLGLMAFGFLTIDSTKNRLVETSHCKAIEPSAQYIATIDPDPVEKIYSDFFYDFGTRFGGIKKSVIDQARSVSDLVYEAKGISDEKFDNVTVIIVEHDVQTDIREKGKSGKLNKKQLALLSSADYSTNFLIRAEFAKKYFVDGKWENDHITPYLTIVPEKQAEYNFGKKAFLDYLMVNNKENTANLDEDKLKPAKLYFTVTKTGEITHIKLDRTSGYSKIDQTMIYLLNNTPGQWIPAENAKGEKVDQELVVSFGMVGC